MYYSSLSSAKRKYSFLSKNGSSIKSGDQTFLRGKRTVFCFFPLCGKMRKSVRHTSPTHTSSRDIWRGILAIRADEQWIFHFTEAAKILHFIMFWYEN